MSEPKPMNKSNTIHLLEPGMNICPPQPTIEVFMIGSPVIIGDHIEAVITAINIKEHNYITYQVVYWDGNTRKQEWVEQCEIKSHKEQSMLKVGFNAEAWKKHVKDM